MPLLTSCAVAVLAAGLMAPDDVSVAPESAKPDVAAATAPPQWSGLVGFGLILMTGNSRSLTLNGAATAERKTENWIYLLRANGGYGRARPAGESATQTVAENASIQARVDRRFTPKFSGYLLAGADTDHVASIEARPYAEAGLGVLWINEKRKPANLELRTDLAFRYGRELRFQYFPVPKNVPDQPLVAPRLAGLFRWPLSERIVFSEEGEVFPNVVDQFRVLATSTTKFNALLSSAVSFGVAYVVRYDSKPAPGKLATDTALTVGLEATL